MQSDIIDTSWMNGLRAIAVIGVVIHHWLLFVSYDGSETGFGIVAGLVKDLGGTCVHLFFLLSGCGLTISHLRQEEFHLGEWARKRFEKIVVPFWLITVATFALANLVLFALGNWRDSYSWRSLVSYLTFTRNQDQCAWGMNPTLWFMPVIVGLYIFFPFFVSILRKHGIGVFLLLAGLISYGSIVLFRFFAYEIEHQSAVFLFFVLEFAMGMVLGYLAVSRPESLLRLFGASSFLFGVGFYVLSYLVTKFFESGGLYNDPVTAAGVFLITINIWNVLFRNAGERIRSILDDVSRVSYIMYLIHGALILYITIPLLKLSRVLPLNPLLSLVLAGIFVVMVFLLSRFLYGPTMRIANVIAHSL
jgi:peptidoglycan/LPS O-acetylase OafA/YrhL